MKIQTSFRNDEQNGTLYLVPTPIGNLEDITYRAINVLNSVDVIAAEDTRHTKKLCHYFKIDTPLVSYHEHNKDISGEKLIESLKSGKNVALVSDAGMPGISDPGYEMVALCVSQGINVIPLPGANAALTTLIASGLPTNHFYFYGFLPRHKKERNQELEGLDKLTCPIIFYEAPHRLKETLKALNELYPNRQIAIGRELTKKYETFIRGVVKDVFEWALEEEIRGECCMILEGREEGTGDKEIDWWESLSILDHVNHYIHDQGLASKEAIKTVAKDRKIPKRDVYQVYHVDQVD